MKTGAWAAASHSPLDQRAMGKCDASLRGMRIVAARKQDRHAETPVVGRPVFCGA